MIAVSFHHFFSERQRFPPPPRSCLRRLVAQTRQRLEIVSWLGCFNFWWKVGWAVQGNLSVVWIKLWDIILSLGKLLVLFKRQSNPQNDFVFSQWLRKFDGFKPITYVFFSGRWADRRQPSTKIVEHPTVLVGQNRSYRSSGFRSCVIFYGGLPVWAYG